jgi:hypothetical protein
MKLLLPRRLLLLLPKRTPPLLLGLLLLLLKRMPLRGLLLLGRVGGIIMGGSIMSDPRGRDMDLLSLSFLLLLLLLEDRPG